MDEEEKKRKFWEITEKYTDESSEDLEKEEHIFRIVHKFAISNLIVCYLLVGMGIIFSLVWLVSFALVLSFIGFIILTIDIIRYYIHNNKTKEEWKKYLKEIGNLK